MSVFRDFEIEVLRQLLEPTLGAERVDALVYEAEFVSYDYSGCGYFLTVRHPTLPQSRHVYSSPLVLGRSGSVESGFLIFVENGKLMLECYTMGENEVPEGFRDQDVRISGT
jgi:hypothetical protein